MIREGGSWLGPLAKVPAALASGVDPTYPLGPDAPGLVEAALVAPSIFRQMLEAGADPNVISPLGRPVLVEILANHGIGDGKPLVEALVARGARWDTPTPVDIGGKSATLPLLLALPWMHRFQLESVFYALELWGADPGLTDQWGGNIGHHMAHQCYYRHHMDRLGALGVDMDQVAQVSEADLAWAKLSGEWLPSFAGLTPPQAWAKWWGGR